MPDRDAFVVLILKQERDLRAFIGSLVLDREIREDVFQECALTLWREFGKYDEEKSFGAWARGVAANLILQRRHRDQRFPVAFSPETIQAVLDAYDRTDETVAPRAEALAQCVEELPEKSRHLLTLRYERSLPVAEVACETEHTIDAVYQALSRIRMSLEECIRRRLAATI